MSANSLWPDNLTIIGETPGEKRHGNHIIILFLTGLLKTILLLHTLF